MKSRPTLLLILFSLTLVIGWKTTDKSWVEERHNGYNILFKSSDRNNIPEYNKLIENGVIIVETFFNSNFNKEFDIFIHPDRHSYHGQLNASPDISDVEGIDWFVEGLATYASGQLDSLRIIEIKKAISENKIPGNLDSFWTGKLKYGLSGSVVMYIDKKYGRAKLKELLPVSKKSGILSALNTKETELLNEWKKNIQKL